MKAVVASFNLFIRDYEPSDGPFSSSRDNARHIAVVPRHPGPRGVEDALLAREVDAALHAGPHAVQEGGLDTRHGG